MECQQICTDDELHFLLRRLTAKRPKSARSLLEAAVRYFKAAGSTTLPNAIGKPVARPWTLSGLLLSAGLTKSDWRDYKNQIVYRRVCETIEMTIRTQKFELAATGAYNSTIMSRDLGLVDKTDTTTAGEAMLPCVFVRKIVDVDE